MVRLGDISWWRSFSLEFYVENLTLLPHDDLEEYVAGERVGRAQFSFTANPFGKSAELTALRPSE